MEINRIVYAIYGMLMLVLTPSCQETEDFTAIPFTTIPPTETPGFTGIGLSSKQECDAAFAAMKNACDIASLPDYKPDLTLDNWNEDTDESALKIACIASFMHFAAGSPCSGLLSYFEYKRCE